MPVVAVGEMAYKNYVGGEWVDAASARLQRAQIDNQ
jgi:hypothetical protein